MEVPRDFPVVNCEVVHMRRSGNDLPYWHELLKIGKYDNGSRKLYQEQK
ncbi:MAG: hypothetical protein LBI20_01600 [Holosporales bacterium]|jgi:hypothetical protein|nr:hypothetical protein [Holosporales bacterium]